MTQYARAQMIKKVWKNPQFSAEPRKVAKSYGIASNFRMPMPPFHLAGLSAHDLMSIKKGGITEVDCTGHGIC